MALTKSVSEIIAEDTTGLLGIHPSWSRVRLRDVATVLNGYAFESDLFSTESGTPLIRIRNVLDGSTNTYYAGDYDDQYVVQNGELLIGMDGDFHCARWKGAPALLNQRVCKLDVEELNYEAQLLDYALPGYLAAINEATSSITVKHLSSRTVEDINLPLPPRAEQTRIVEKLEELLSDLDDGVAELKAAQRKLVHYRQSLLKAAVEGVLTADWRAARAQTGEPQENGAELLQRILTERRARWEASQLARFTKEGKTPHKGWQAKYKEPIPPDTADLPALPEGWVWASLDQLADTVRNGLSQKPNTDLIGYPILRINAVRSMSVRLDQVRHLSISQVEASAYTLDEGDLLATRYNGSVDLLGVFGVVRGLKQTTLHPDKLIRIKPVLGPALADWIEVCASTGSSRRHVVSKVKTTAGQTGISGDDIKKMPVPLPPAGEQLACRELTATAIRTTADQAIAIDHALKQSAAQRNNILKAAFAGQLVPQDPNDEPASVLLERIRATRANAGTAPTRRGSKAKETA